MVIGKYALESITTGMYVNPMDVLREYIQNAADAIDSAVSDGVLSLCDAKILITIDALQRKVTIEDNGSGIPLNKALTILTDIGNSEKQQSQSRGFRGIGRLSGLSYADKLVFRTSFSGENEGIEVAYDAKQLRKLLAQHELRSLTAEDAIESIYTVKRFSAAETAHFFTVIMEGISSESGLLNEDDIYEYLHQTIPVDYDGSVFSWSSVINQEIRPAVYPTYLITRSGKREIRKAYSDFLLTNRTNGDSDQITDIRFVTLKSNDGSPLGTVWYSLSNFKGSIADRATKGLRLRVGNILVGDNHSLDYVFKDGRFNGWVIGEVHISSSALLLNARRDDFERNTAYYRLEEQLRAIAVEITQKIRSSSVARNKALSVALKKVDQIAACVNEELANPMISASTKGKLTVQIATARREIHEIPAKRNEAALRNEALAKLDALTGKISGATQFRAINMLSNITAAEKGMLARLFRNLLEKNSEEEARRCIGMILDTYAESEG